MKSIMTTLVGHIVLIAALTHGSACRADIILEVGDVGWNQMGEVPQLIFAVLADSNETYGAESNSINSFNLIFSIRPVGDAVGTLGVQVVAPTSNRLFESFSDLIFNADIGGGFASIQGQNIILPSNPQPANVNLAADMRRNLVALNITPSADALGEFSVFVSSTSNYALIDEFDGVAFSNLPFNDPPADLRLGTFRVTAVPEPSSVVLTLIGFIAIALQRLRSKRMWFVG